MKKDSSEVVATSSDLCDVDQTILVLNDEKNIVINSKKRVRIYGNYYQKILNYTLLMIPSLVSRYCEGYRFWST